jgi:hypothetical protein
MPTIINLPRHSERSEESRMAVLSKNWILRYALNDGVEMEKLTKITSNGGIRMVLTFNPLAAPSA